MPVQLHDVPRHGKIDKTDFTLKWKRPGENGAPITKYKVYQRTVNENGEEMSWRDIDSTPGLEYHVSNLERGKIYEFKVTATNRIGEGKEDKRYFKTVKVKAGKSS